MRRGGRENEERWGTTGEEEEECKGNPSINNTTLKTINHMTTNMVITNTRGNTKPPGRTHGLRPAHETARTLRHHYEEEEL